MSAVNGSGSVSPLAVYGEFLTRSTPVGARRGRVRPDAPQRLLHPRHPAGVFRRARDRRGPRPTRRDAVAEEQVAPSLARRIRLTRSEVVRSWSNYHPLVTSRIWRGAIDAADAASTTTACSPCASRTWWPTRNGQCLTFAAHCGMPFSAEMLDVPEESSSLASDDPDARACAATWPRPGAPRAGCRAPSTRCANRWPARRCGATVTSPRRRATPRWQARLVRRAAGEAGRGRGDERPPDRQPDHVGQTPPRGVGRRSSPPEIYANPTEESRFDPANLISGALVVSLPFESLVAGSHRLRTWALCPRSLYVRPAERYDTTSQEPGPSTRPRARESTSEEVADDS